MLFELRKYKEDDYVNFFKYSNDADVLGNMSGTFPKTIEDCHEIVKEFTSTNEEKQFIRAVIINGEFVGSIGAFVGDDIYEKSAEVAYWIGKPFWHKGIMTDVLKQFCNIMFEYYDIARIYARPFSYNLGSQRLLEKAGFDLEGIMKKSVYKDGKFCDSYLYSLIK